MRALVTGITGFAGSHLVDYMLAEKKSVEVVGIQRWRSRTENIEHFAGKVRMFECDLRDASSVRDVLDEARPDWIFHLAAQSFVPTSWTAPTESLVTNIIGQLNIFEAVKKLHILPRIQLACSSEEYGMVYENELPIRETNPLRPLSPYAVSKVGQDMLGYQYFMSFKLPVIRVGNLEARRDFTDVRDVVRGYWLALEKGQPGEVYNLCSGRAWTIRAMLDQLLGMTQVKVKVEQDPARMRPSDVPVLLGDAGKFKKATGWEPTIPFETTLRDLLEYWRAR